MWAHQVIFSVMLSRATYIYFILNQLCLDVTHTHIHIHIILKLFFFFLPLSRGKVLFEWLGYCFRFYYIYLLLWGKSWFQSPVAFIKTLFSVSLHLSPAFTYLLPLVRLARINPGKVPSFVFSQCLDPDSA